MSTIFTKIIQGEFPARFIHKDDICVAFLSINPLQTGHTLVVPIVEIDHWLDLPTTTLHHCMDVAKRIGDAQTSVYSPNKIGVMLAGLEVPHTHIHVLPIWSVNDLDFNQAETNPTEESLDQAQRALVEALRTMH